MSYADAKPLAFLVADEDQFEEPLDGISLLALRRGQCRWPLGDMIDFATRFCGCDAPVGDSYCAAHRALAYAGFPRGVGLRPISTCATTS